MRKWFALSAIAQDHPGIVADLAELIYACDCNLEDSSMTVLGSEFAVLLLLSGQGQDLERRLSSACKRLEWEKRVTVFFRPLDGEPTPHLADGPVTAYELHATGIDKAGIVARITRCLADHGVNITHMQTHARPEPGSGTSIYTMQIQMDVSNLIDITELHKQLDHIADALHIHVDLIPQKEEKT
ncbi:MAG: glycine cleavage system protein R [Candidatus Binatia bacterium]